MLFTETQNIKITKNSKVIILYNLIQAPLHPKALHGVPSISVFWPRHPFTTGHVRERVRWPPPHVFEHSPHSPQSDHNGQACSWHLVDSDSTGHDGGPLGHFTRLRVCVPPPHVAVQGDHCDHSVLSEHALVKHGSILLGEPRQPSAIEHVRVRCRLPWPHVLLKQVINTWIMNKIVIYREYNFVKRTDS